MHYILEAVWKSFLVFFLLVSLTRLIGKKLLSQMTFFDFVIGITIGTISGAYVVTTIEGIWVLVSPVVLTAATMSLGVFTMKNLTARKLLEGEPVIVIQNGKILENNLRKLRYNIDDLEMQLRTQGVFDMTQVEFAILEPHGQLSVLRKSQYLPLTPKDLRMDTTYQGLATEIIKDGQILEQNLKQNGLTLDWLHEELRKRNLTDSQIFYASLNTDGTLYIDIKDDKMGYVQQVED